jgi:hypothetical protein
MDHLIKRCDVSVKISGRNSKVDIAGRFGNQIQVGAKFSAPSRSALGSTRPPIK